MDFVTGPANADIDKYMQWQREQWGVNVATRWFNNLYARFDSLAAMPGQAAECEWLQGLGWLLMPYAAVAANLSIGYLS